MIAGQRSVMLILKSHQQLRCIQPGSKCLVNNRHHNGHSLALFRVVSQTDYYLPSTLAGCAIVSLSNFGISVSREKSLLGLPST